MQTIKFGYRQKSTLLSNYKINLEPYLIEGFYFLFLKTVKEIITIKIRFPIIVISNERFLFENSKNPVETTATASKNNALSKLGLFERLKISRITPTAISA
ncbi:hypothetical protein [Paenibacillus alvei]|uniref:hypothetical protein n=1 Tax=Paenibacillus alvei TaxID=44250 RepID=UPI002282AE75|nr:hypothetical protein [Paenibacillus alvei]MCY7484240.1 hypothetical protein [Paenibacillus alvei]